MPSITEAVVLLLRSFRLQLQKIQNILSGQVDTQARSAVCLILGTKYQDLRSSPVCDQNVQWTDPNSSLVG